MDRLHLLAAAQMAGHRKGARHQRLVADKLLFMRHSLLFLAATCAAVAAPPEPEPTPNRLLRDYFARDVTTIESQPLPAPQTLQEWEKTRASMRKQLAEMLGLDPMPARTPLNATTTGEMSLD